MKINGVFLTNVRPLLIFGGILGIIPYTFKSGIFKRIMSPILFFLPVTLVSTTTLYKAFSEILPPYMFVGESRRIVASFILIVSAVNIIARIILNYKNRNLIRSVLNEVDSTSQAIQKKTRIYAIMIIISLGHIFLIMIEAARGYAKHKKPPPKFYSYLVSHVNFFITFLETFFIDNIMIEIGNQLKRINKSLDSENKKLQLNKDLSKIIDFVDQHSNLVSTAKLINRIFSLNILINVASNFVLITTSTFFAVSHIKRIMKYNRIISGIVLYGTWDLMLLTNVFFVINAFVTTAKEAKKTATIIHDIWNKCATESNIDSNVNHLQLISVQLLNIQLDFTAYGFFPLDWTLLQAIIGAVTTYVVILIQFEMV